MPKKRIRRVFFALFSSFFASQRIRILKWMERFLCTTNPIFTNAIIYLPKCMCSATAEYDAAQGRKMSKAERTYPISHSRSADLMSFHLVPLLLVYFPRRTLTISNTVCASLQLFNVTKFTLFALHFPLHSIKNMTIKLFDRRKSKWNKARSDKDGLINRIKQKMAAISTQ